MPSADQTLDALLEFLRADTWDKSRRTVNEHPELLNVGTGMIDIMLKDPMTVSMVYPGRSRSAAEAALRKHKAVLARCREVGTARAFAEVSEQQRNEREHAEGEDAAREKAEWERTAPEWAAQRKRSRRRIVVVLVSIVAFIGAGVAGVLHFAGATTPPGPVRTLDDSAGNVQAVAFSPSGDIVAAGDAADKVYLWNATNGQQIATFTGPEFSPNSSGEGVNAVAFNPDGNILAVGDVGGTYLLNVSNGKKIAAVTDPNDVGTSTVAFSPGGNVMATGDSDDHTYLWQLSNDRKRASITVSQAGSVTGGSYGVAFSPNGRMLATIDSGGKVHLWKIPGEHEIATLTDPSTASNGNVQGAVAVAFNPNSMMLATGDSDGNVYLWELPGDREIASLKGSGDTVNAVAFSMNGATLVAQDNKIDVWKVSNKQKISTFTPELLSAWQGLALDSKGGLVASGYSNTGSVVLLKIPE